MGEDSKECEFWLPPQFLNDDDILFGFKNKNESKRYFGCDFQNEFSYGFNMFGPNSDLSSPVESVVGSTETESEEEEEDYITELTRQMAHSTLDNHKVQNLSSSPQSTLCGVLGSTQSSKSESPKSPFQASSPTEGKVKKGTVDLLYAAVGEVARMKMMEEQAGLCHHRNGIWAPPPKISEQNLGSFYSNQPPLSYQQLQMVHFQRLKQQQMMKQRQGVLGHDKDGFWQHQLSQNYQQLTQMRNRNGADRPLNIAKSAWPTLHQSHAPRPNLQQSHAPPQSGSGTRDVFIGNHGTKRECAGTGVFIPRRVGTQTETRKKPGCSTVLMPDRVVQALNLNLQRQVQPTCNNNGGGLKYRNNNVAAEQQWLNFRSQPVAMSQELQLPQEWTY